MAKQFFTPKAAHRDFIARQRIFFTLSAADGVPPFDCGASGR